jgi:hypothetical protein
VIAAFLDAKGPGVVKEKLAKYNAKRAQDLSNAQLVAMLQEMRDETP